MVIFALLKHIIYLPMYLLPYILTPWSRVLFEKVTVSQLVKKFPTSNGTRRLIIAFTRIRYLCLSKISLQIRGTCLCFVTIPVFMARSCQHLTQHPSRRITPCRLYTTAYSIYSQLPFILEAVPPSAAGGQAMLW
jgi:hypothetical protein